VDSREVVKTLMERKILLSQTEEETKSWSWKLKRLNKASFDILKKFQIFLGIFQNFETMIFPVEEAGKVGNAGNCEGSDGRRLEGNGDDAQLSTLPHQL
jgi:hypothetical protein